MIYFRSLEHQFLHKQLAVLIVCDLNCKKSCYVAHNWMVVLEDSQMNWLLFSIKKENHVLIYTNCTKSALGQKFSK